MSGGDLFGPDPTKFVSVTRASYDNRGVKAVDTNLRVIFDVGQAEVLIYAEREVTIIVKVLRCNFVFNGPEGLLEKVLG